MKSEWKIKKLGDLCNISSSKRIFAKEYCSKGIPFYRSKEIIEKNRGNAVSTEFFISEERYAEIKKRNDVPKIGDILLSSVGALGVPWLVDEEKFYFKDGNLTWLRVGEELDNKFLYLWLCSPEAKHQIEAKCIGSTQKAITIEPLSKFDICIPSIDTQRKISNILFAIINKIALNNRINDNLQQQLFTLYDELINTHEIREKVELKTLCAFQEGYVNPAQTCQEYFDGNVKWLRAVDINESFIIETSRTLSTSGFESTKKSALLFQPNTIAISKSGTIGRIGIIADYMCGNRAVINIRPFNPNQLPLIYAYLKSKQREFPNLAVGSVQKNLYVSQLEPLQVVLPDIEAVNQFCDIGCSLLLRVQNNCKENLVLTNLRNSLLPQLMVGKINVSAI